ncbi:MAG: 5'-nucleotidase C-terminal domain-containing protein [Armatimonadetes bacterium]|nr:hypothetical protein [Armatimonadota bacterium]MBS1700579.1 5'-nucleotidase C-terminal domain-containing protein [Armatimonadota bacterium]
MVTKFISLGTGILIAVSAMAQVASANGPSAQETQVGQSIADIFRSASGADIAFVASGFLSVSKDTKDLASSFQFPTDELWLVTLTGKQLNEAFEKSISFYPESSPDMLFLSGTEVTFQTARASRPKILSANVAGTNLDPAKTYTVSMPASLARGGLCYYSVWNFTKPEKVISPSIEKLLKGKSVQTSTLRWLSHQSL